MNTVNALTFRQKFGEIIDRVVATGDPVVIERQNKPVVVMYPYEERQDELVKQNEKAKKQKLLKMLADWRTKWGSSDARDSTKLIRKMRDNRYGKRWWKTRTNY